METRSQPGHSFSRALVAGEAGGAASGEIKQMPFGIRSTRSQPVMPAGYFGDAMGGDSNPLRGTSQRPIGSGVAEPSDQ
jgi:hypothetical protein